MSKVQAMVQKNNALYTKLAKKALKKKEIIVEIKDMKEHFKKDKWPLSYSFYKSTFKVPDKMFNIILELKGFTPYYDKNRKSICIKKK